MEDVELADPESSPGNLRLVENTRLLIEKLVACPASELDFARAADLVRDAVELIDSHGLKKEYRILDRYPLPGPWDPVTGVLHAFAPPLALEIVPGDPYATVMGRGAYGHAYEGVPGCLHGGHVSIAFDEVLLLASAMDGVLRMTGQLNVTYRLPVPICTDIRYEARLDRIEGRKAFVTGTLHAGDVLCAEATGLFIAPREGRIEELHLEREAR